MEQRATIKSCFKSGKTATETYEIVQKAYRHDCLSRAVVFMWFKRFKGGRQSLEDDKRKGRPSTSNIDTNVERVRLLLAQDRRRTIRLIADKLNISIGSVHNIVHNKLDKRELYAKFVPHFLTPEQKEQRVTASQNFIKLADLDPNFLNNIIAGSESWCFAYDPTIKCQSLEVGSEQAKSMKTHATKPKVKTMLIAFFDSRGMVHQEFVPQGQTINGLFYRDVMNRLLKQIQRVRSELYRSNKWFLLHDNSPAHLSIVVSQFLVTKNVNIITHPSYSPDLAPADFFLFPKLKLAMEMDSLRRCEDNST